MIRRPAVAGYFYPKEKKELEHTLSLLFSVDSSQKQQRNAVVGAILPHAGYQYSGKVAAQTVSACTFKEIFIILGPNHTGLGEPFSVMTEGSWATPLGDVPIHVAVTKTLVQKSKYLREDTLAHASEHSIEVLIPFLQYIQKEIAIVPLVIAHASFGVYQDMAKDIYDTIMDLNLKDRVTLLASSDMTHYEPQSSAEDKDRYAIEAILRLDSENLLKRVEERRISMCGIAPVLVMLEVAKKLGAKDAHLVKYQTSGDTTGDYDAVVGYAGITVR